MPLTEARITEIKSALRENAEWQEVCDLALAQIRGRGQAVMILNEDRVPEWLPPYDRPEPGTKLYAAQQPAQEPIGWLDWPSLEFRPNRNVKWCGPESVKFDPIPVFAALRQSGAGRDFIAKFEKIVKDESEQWKGVSDDTYGAQTACQMILQKIISLKERTK